jgi:drug/metabolite transporter (DMT)-like permease
MRGVPVPFLPASLLRLSAAAAGLIVLGVFDGRVKRAAGLARSVPDRRRVLMASFLGSYIGIMLMMAGISLAPAAVAAVLLSTTPVFALASDVARGAERLTLRGAGGTLLAITGVALISAA